MIIACSTRTLKKARTTKIAKFTSLTPRRTQPEDRKQKELTTYTLRLTVVNQRTRALTPVEEVVLALNESFAIEP